jgi:hypothetical protein
MNRVPNGCGVARMYRERKAGPYLEQFREGCLTVPTRLTGLLRRGSFHSRTGLRPFFFQPIASRLRTFGFLIFVFSAVVCRAFSAQNDGESEAIKQFKRFIASPPPVEECIFREMVNPDTDHSVTNIYFVRWQPNAAVVRRFLDESRFYLSKTGTSEYVGNSSGYFSSNYWHIEKTAFTEWSQGDALSGGESPRQHIDLVITLSFSRIMNGGEQRVDIGTIRWNGDSYTVTNRAGTRLDGRLLTRNGLPAGMEVSGVYNGTEFKRRYRYAAFDLKDLPYLPSRIESINDAGQPTYILEIGKLKVARRLLRQNAFQPTEYFHRHLIHRIAIDETGRPLQSDFNYSSARRTRYRLVFLVICIFVPIVAIALYHRGQTQNKQQEGAIAKT